MSELNAIDILIIGDSRLRHIKENLNNISFKFNFTVISLPGANLHQITLKVLTSLSYTNNFKLVIISGGINNMTKLVHIPTRHALPRYGSVNIMTESVLSEIRRAVYKIKKITDIPIVVATFPGIDLVSYSPEYTDLLSPLQEVIDQAVVDINKRIRGINRLNETQTLNLAYPVHRCKGKMGLYRNQYSLLSDGLHPGEVLLKKWADNIILFCSRLFPENTHFHVETGDSQTQYQYQY